DIAHHGNIYAGSYRNHKRAKTSGYIGSNPGIATMKFNKHSKEDSFAYGAGVIFNPVKSISIDASWEASRFFAVDTNTFGVSVGYRF
ncbi:Ail/Lom family outer membrane beta-barrel protein, partial [Salmonella enterica]|uniref:Ail/Lom family outer membrane beta-barrel protein n=3 Tax=Salmonella enterica TaxID=28901 RepID=UPI001EF15A35